MPVAPFFCIFQMLLPQNIYFNISRGKCKTHSACLCYRRVFFGPKYLALMVRAAGLCFPLAGQICKFYADIFGHLVILRCFGVGLVGHGSNKPFFFFHWVIIHHKVLVMVTRKDR
jgi:hypothetical protein